MTSRYDVIPATDEHAVELAPNMREADQKEIWASSRMLPLEALRRSMDVSPAPMTGLVDGEVVCMFGIGQASLVNTGNGVPWLLASGKMNRHARAFFKLSREYIESAKKDYHLLVNRVDARNKASIRWLRWLGFTLDEPRPFGYDDIPFHLFYFMADEEEGE